VVTVLQVSPPTLRMLFSSPPLALQAQRISSSFLTLFFPMCSIFYTQYTYFHLTHLFITIKSTYKATCFGPIGPSSDLTIRTGSFTSSTFWDAKWFDKCSRLLYCCVLLTSFVSSSMAGQFLWLPHSAPYRHTTAHSVLPSLCNTQQQFDASYMTLVVLTVRPLPSLQLQRINLAAARTRGEGGGVGLP
jgi:hypothetical protein